MFFLGQEDIYIYIYILLRTYVLEWSKLDLRAIGRGVFFLLKARCYNCAFGDI